MWRELKDWKSNWKKSTFFQALVFGLAASFFDCGTDFYFAWTVPGECSHEGAELDFRIYVSTPCGTIPFNTVEAWTYTAIALPGILLGIAGIQHRLKDIVFKCYPGQIHWCIKGTANVISIAIEALFCVLLILAATWNRKLTNEHPKLGYVHSITVKVLAYLSATFIIGVKLLGLFSHGPETSRLILRVTAMETKYEACLQLLLVANILLSSTMSMATFATYLSGLSSLIVISKVGVEKLFEKHKEQVSECSLWGKIALAATALPVFLLATFFKIGSLALISGDLVWTRVVFLGFAASSTTLLLLKMCRSKNDQVLTSINQGILAELLTLHLWPKGQLGNRVGVGMTTFIFLLYSFSVACHVANPEDLSKIFVSVNKSDPAFQAWMSERTARLQTTSACFLGLGVCTFILVIGFILLQDKLVTTTISKFPEQITLEDIGADLGTENEKKKKPKDQNAENQARINAELTERFRLL